MNCCDYDCHQGHNCPARSATCPTHKPHAKTMTPEQIEAAGKAATARLQATAPAAPATTAHNTSELPSPLEQIDVFPPPPRALVYLSYVLTAALALVGLFILLGHAAAKLEKVFA